MQGRNLVLALFVPLALCHCGHAGGSFPKGQEPAVHVTDLELPADEGPGQVTLDISNPNDWPVTLVRLQLEVGGAVQGRNSPGYDSVHLEVPSHGSQSLAIEMDLQTPVTVRSGATPGTMPPIPPDAGGSGGSVHPMTDPGGAVVMVIGRLYFKTPQGTLSAKVSEKRVL
jgi:hypothetical protein